MPCAAAKSACCCVTEQLPSGICNIITCCQILFPQCHVQRPDRHAALQLKTIVSGICIVITCRPYPFFCALCSGHAADTIALGVCNIITCCPNLTCALCSGQIGMLLCSKARQPQGASSASASSGAAGEPLDPRMARQEPPPPVPKMSIPELQ